MENDIIDSLKDIGYVGKLVSHDEFLPALEAGIKSVDFRSLLVWLADEIRVLGNLDERIIDVPETEGDLTSFVMEISAFLKELGCPYRSLVEGYMSERLQTKESRLLLLDYLVSELMLLRINNCNAPEAATEITLHESTTAQALRQILLVFGLPKPPDNINVGTMFSKLQSKLKEYIRKAGPDRVGKALFLPNKPLNSDQWKLVDKIQCDLNQEYKLRQQMLLTRLDVTIQSFQWSERLKGREDDITRLFTSRRNALGHYGSSGVDLGSLLAARTDLAIIEKTSSASVRRNTQSNINKVMIGRVPDRGGRPSEQAAPPPEMPSWQQQRAPGGGAQRGGFGGGRGRGSGRGGGNFSRDHPPSSGGGNGNFSQDRPQSGRGGGEDYNQRGGNQSRVQGQWNQGGGARRGGGSYSNRGGAYAGGNQQQSYQDSNLQQQSGYQDRNSHQQSGYQDRNLQQQSGYQDRNSQQQSGYQDRNSQQQSGYQDRSSQQQSGYQDGHQRRQQFTPRGGRQAEGNRGNWY